VRCGTVIKSKKMSFQPSRDDTHHVARPVQNVQYEDATRTATSTKNKSPTTPKLKRQSVGAGCAEAFISGPKDDWPILTAEMVLNSRTVAEVADLLHISKKTLQNRLSADKVNPSPNPNFPMYFKLGKDGEPLFPREWTNDWLQRNIQMSGVSPNAKF
jgi:hypothetical protein